MNQSQPPYRTPCAGTITCSNGPRYRHGKASELNIPVFLYNTTVCDWHWTDCPNGCSTYADCEDGSIGPYERWASGTESSTCPSPCEEGDGCPEPPCLPCGPWQWTLDNPAPTPSFYQPQMVTAATIASGGTGYEVGDVLMQSGGTTSSWQPPFNIGGTSLNITVTKVDGSGVITGINITQPGSFQANPSSPNSMIEGHGTGASINLTFGNQTENLSPCFKYGFKNVQAKRYWHGQEGYFFGGQVGQYQCPDTDITEESGGCLYNFFTQYSLDAPQTKYLTVSWDVTYQFVYDDPDFGEINDELATSFSIDPDSGVITVNSFTASDGSGLHADVFGSYTEKLPTSFLSDWVVTALAVYRSGTGNDVGDNGMGGPQGYEFQCDANEWQVFGNPELGAPEDYTNVTATASWSISDNSISISHESGQTSSDGDAAGPNVNFMTMSQTDSSLNFSMTQPSVDPGGSAGGTLTVTVTVTLSDPNTPSDVQSDIVTLLDEWDLTNDAEYPWRNDQYVSIAPLVTRNEVQGNVGALLGVVGYTIVDGTPTTWVDSHAALYDGTIMGAPLPAGYQGTFDFNYVDAQWCDTGGAPGNTCDGEESDSSFFQVRGFGGYVNGLLAQLPENATQWTPNPIAAGLSGGAWIFYNHNPSYTGCADSNSCYTYNPQVGSGYCMAQKWAETKMGFASQNFARPAGDDKFSYDEDNVFTINSSNTTNGVTTVHLVNSISCANANTSPSLGSGIWGGLSVNGFFQVTGNGSPFTLGTKIFNVPSDWDTESGTWDANTSSFNSDANTAFGLLRWPNSPAILGLAGISNTSNSNGNTELVSISIPSLGMGVSNANADNVDLYDKFLNVLASNAAVTRVDDTHFKVPVSFATAQNTAYITSNGATPYYWDDSSPKGDYAYTDWTWWPRLICEAARINNLFASCTGSNCGNSATTNCNCDAITCETIYCNPFYDQSAGGNAQPITAGFDAAFTQEAGCIPFNPCNPSVICISPNGESFPLGHTWPFKTIQFDEQYGSGWQAEPQQVMVDLLYQQPHYPAVAPCTIAPFAWLEDGGICSDGGANAQYFPHAPMVECLIALPSNGGPNSNAAPPSLPSGITIGWSSPAGTNANCNNQPDNTLFPPGAVGFGLQAATVWGLWSNECACIDALGRFAPDYSENVLGCQ